MTIAILGRDGKQEHVLSVPQGLHLWARDGNGVLLTDWRRGAWRVSLEQATPTMTPLPGKHPGPMVALAGNRPDPLALVAYGNGNIGLVHLTQPGKRLDWIQEMNGTNHGAIAPDASRYASIDHETHTIMMYDRTRGGAPWRWHLPVMTSRLHFSPSGDALLAAGVERAFLLSFAPQPTWHAIASMPESIGPLLAKGRRLVLPDGRQGPEGHAAAITATATAADRIFSGDQDGWLLVWDAAHLRCLWRERIGSGPITAIVPGEPLRLRSGKDTLALPVMGR
jgi:hypothetical protein